MQMYIINTVYETVQQICPGCLSLLEIDNNSKLLLLSWMSREQGGLVRTTICTYMSGKSIYNSILISTNFIIKKLNKK